MEAETSNRYNLRRSKGPSTPKSTEKPVRKPKEEVLIVSSEMEVAQRPSSDKSESAPIVVEDSDSRDSSLQRGVIDVDKEGGMQGINISEEMLSNLSKLRNALKLQKARRFVYCEFFYSPVDAQLFLAENEFMSLVREHLPNLRTRKLRMCEWREMRRIIGRPRRLSANFLAGERETLEMKRAKIRELYKGHVTQLDPDSIDLPSKLPRPLMVGTKVFARVGGARDSILSGTIDAVQEEGYRVVFDRDEHLSVVVRDDEVMCVQKPELLNVSYFLSTNKANLKPQIPGATFATQIVDRIHQPVITGFTIDPQSHMSHPVYAHPHVKKEASTRNDKVGNFPVRMLVIVVKMCKLLEHKRTTLRQLKTLNDEAIRMQRYGCDYPDKFLKVVAEVIIDLETLNKMLRVYAEALNPYRQTLFLQRSRQVVTDRPEVLRKTCHNHAYQILKHCSSILDVKDQQVKDIIASLSSLLIQIRFLGQHAVNSRSCAEEVQILQDSLKELKELIPPATLQSFQDGVEVHMKQIFNTLLKVRPQTNS